MTELLLLTKPKRRPLRHQKLKFYVFGKDNNIHMVCIVYKIRRSGIHEFRGVWNQEIYIRPKHRTSRNLASGIPITTFGAISGYTRTNPVFIPRALYTRKWIQL